MKQHVDNPFQSPVVLSFCPGILGIERGLARAGCKVRVAAYVEIEAFIIANLLAGMESGVLDPTPIWTDVKTFDAKPFHRKIHGIVGGYPCQPFSQNGKRKGKDDPRHLWPFIKDHIRTIQPIWCFFENVRGHLTLGYHQVRQELEQLDFTVKEGIYSAAECGASIKRERLFILAISNRCRSGQDWQPGKQWASGTQQPSIDKGSVQSNGIQQKPQGRWPAGAYKEQYEWEEPRVIEPGIRSATHGYNFRPDFLRAIGNSVVEQTAEIAFIDLLNKHLNHEK